MPQESNDYRVTVLGAAGVGKSSIVQRFTCGTFREHHAPTVEDTYRKVISSNGQLCTLQITDTTGSYHFPAMQRLAIQRSHAFVLVYSVASRASLDALTSIFEEIAEIKGGTDLVPVMLVGNKADEDEGPAAGTGTIASVTVIPGSGAGADGGGGGTGGGGGATAAATAAVTAAATSTVPALQRQSSSGAKDGCVSGTASAALASAARREVHRADGILLANRWRCGFLETSARTSGNVENVFDQLLQLERRRSMSLRTSQTGATGARKKAKVKGGRRTMRAVGKLAVGPPPPPPPSPLSRHASGSGGGGASGGRSPPVSRSADGSPHRSSGCGVM